MEKRSIKRNNNKKREKFKFEQHSGDTAVSHGKTSPWPVQFTSIQPIFSMSLHAVKTWQRQHQLFELGPTSAKL